MSFCQGCGTKIGMPGCFCPTLYPQEVKAYKSQSGDLYPTPGAAIRADFRIKLRDLLMPAGDETKPYQVQVNAVTAYDFIIKNADKLKEIFHSYPTEKDAP